MDVNLIFLIKYNKFAQYSRNINGTAASNAEQISSSFKCISNNGKIASYESFLIHSIPGSTFTRVYKYNLYGLSCLLYIFSYIF